MIRLVALLSLTACLPQVGPLVSDDAGIDAGDDAGLSDGGASCSDLILDGNESAVDCGGACAPCPDTRGCRTALDCASGVCAQGTCAAPAIPCGAYAGCTSFVDLTGQAADVRFPNGNNRYSPQCVRVRFGQRVTFTGDFSSHPMQPSCGPIPSALRASSGSTLAVTFDQALGVFGYYCTQHGSPSGAGMAGAIEVVR